MGFQKLIKYTLAMMASTNASHLDCEGLYGEI